MSRAPLLETFDLAGAGRQPTPHDAAAEELRLASFELGYRAGWDDCVRAGETAAAATREAIATQLQSLSFTYHEAHDHILRAIEPLLHEMTARVLPLSARRSLVPTVVDLLKTAATDLARQPVVIAVNPDVRAALQAALPTELDLPLSVVEDSALGEAQARLRLGDTERRVDLGGTVAAIGAAIEAYFSDAASKTAITETNDDRIC